MDDIITAPPQIEPEIVAGLAELKKKGYRVTSEQGASGELLLHFQLGASEQTLKFANDEWQKSGTVQKRIVDKLDI
jgi:hypothetical protein